MRLLAFTLSVLVGPSACSSWPTTLPLTTAGFVTEKPVPGTRAMFRELWPYEFHGSANYGAEEQLKEYMADWLRKVGIVLVVPRSSRFELLEEQRFRLRHGDESVQIGQLQGVAWLIEVRVRASLWQDPAVRVQATSVETGEIVWMGSATMPRCRPGPWDLPVMSGDAPTRRTLELLADYALATAFGFTAPGAKLITVDGRCVG